MDVGAADVAGPDVAPDGDAPGVDVAGAALGASCMEEKNWISRWVQLTIVLECRTFGNMDKSALKLLLAPYIRSALPPSASSFPAPSDLLLVSATALYSVPSLDLAPAVALPSLSSPARLVADPTIACPDCRFGLRLVGW